MVVAADGEMAYSEGKWLDPDRVPNLGGLSEELDRFFSDRGVTFPTHSPSKANRKRKGRRHRNQSGRRRRRKGPNQLQMNSLFTRLAKAKPRKGRSNVRVGAFEKEEREIPKFLQRRGHTSWGPDSPYITPKEKREQEKRGKKGREGRKIREDLSMLSPYERYLKSRENQLENFSETDREIAEGKRGSLTRSEKLKRDIEQLAEDSWREAGADINRQWYAPGWGHKDTIERGEEEHRKRMREFRKQMAQDRRDNEPYNKRMERLSNSPYNQRRRHEQKRYQDRRAFEQERWDRKSKRERERLNNSPYNQRRRREQERYQARADFEQERNNKRWERERERENNRYNWGF